MLPSAFASSSRHVLRPSEAGLRMLLVLVGLAPGCQQAPVSVSAEPQGPAWFRDVTADVGLDFVHDAGPAGSYFFPQVLGAGAALFDFDNDGRLDLYLLQSAGPDGR